KVAQSGGGTQVLKNSTFLGGTRDWSIWDKASEGKEFHRGTFTAEVSGGLWVQGLSRGSLMQNVPYTPGSYLARVDYSVPETVTGAYGNLLVHILDANGRVLNLQQIILPATNM